MSLLWTFLVFSLLLESQYKTKPETFTLTPMEGFTTNIELGPSLCKNLQPRVEGSRRQRVLITEVLTRTQEIFIVQHINDHKFIKKDIKSIPFGEVMEQKCVGNQDVRRGLHPFELLAPHLVCQFHSSYTEKLKVYSTILRRLVLLLCLHV